MSPAVPESHRHRGVGSTVDEIMSLLCFIFWQLWKKQKHPSKTPQNHKSQPKERPRHHFAFIVGTILASILMKIARQPKVLKTQHVSNGNSAITHPGLPFWHQVSIKILILLDIVFGCFCIFNFWVVPKVRFCDPL